MQDRYRLKKGSDFRRAYSARRRHNGALLTLYARPNHLDHARIGFAVSTKVGGAVVRNLVKRRLREASRDWVEGFVGDGIDFVVVAHPEAAAAGFGALRDDLLGLFATLDRTVPEDIPRARG